MSWPQYFTMLTGRAPPNFCTVRPPPLVVQLLDRLQVRLIERLVEIALGGALDVLHVVVRARHVEAPVGGVGEDDLLAEAELLRLGEDPLVGGADDGLLADEQMGLNRDLLAEAGLFDADDVGDGAEALQALRAHDDAELRRVVEHDRQRGALGEGGDEFDDLVFGLRDHVGGRRDQEVVAGGLGEGGETSGFLEGGVGDVRGDGPLAGGLVGDGLDDPAALVAGQAPELAHAPTRPRAPRAQAADVADVVADGRLVDFVVGGERRGERGPLAGQIFPSPVLGLVFGIPRHCCPFLTTP